MSQAEQLIVDASDLRKYRTELPNLVDDVMDPYQMRLYVHYKRVCGATPNGKCNESVRTTAERTRMSVGKVVQTRDWLRENGWITVEPLANGLLIRIVDRWVENFLQYAPMAQPATEKCSPGEHSPPKCSCGEQLDTESVHVVNTEPQSVHVVNGSVHDMNSGVHHMNERKNQYEERTNEERTDLPNGPGEPAAPAPEALDPVPLADQFRLLLDELKTTPNKPAVLRRIYELCYGRQNSPPNFGYLGRVAKQVGGAGRLAQLLWELTARPPAGDVLGYIQAAHAAQAKHRRKQARDEPESEEELRRRYIPDEYAGVIIG